MPLGEIGEVLEEMARVDRQRPHVLNQIAQLDDLAPQHLLDVTELRRRGVALGLRQAPPHVDLHLEADERLNDAVVQLARDARALGRAAARLHLRLHVERVQHEPRLAHHRVEEAERACAAGGVQHEEAVGPFGAERA